MMRFIKTIFLSVILLPALFLIVFNQFIPKQAEWKVNAAVYDVCFPAGTNIQTPSGTTPVENLRIGDRVLGVNPIDHSFRTQKVTSLYKSTQSFLYELILSSGKKISATPMHPFAVWNSTTSSISFVPIKNLKKDMLIMTKGMYNTLGRESIQSISKINTKTVVYNVSVNPDSTFIAEGILVHNKGGTTSTPVVAPPNCADPCYHTNPSNPNNSCAGGQPVCNATVNGVDGYFYQGSDGTYWFGQKNNADDDDGGGGSDWPPIPTPNPTPTGVPGDEGTIQVYAVTGTSSFLNNCDAETGVVFLRKCLLNPGLTGCSAANSSYLLNTTIYLNGFYPITQVDDSGATYTTVPSKLIYNISAAYPSNQYVPHMTCTKNASTNWTENSAAYLYPNSTQTFLVGMGPVRPWFQIKEGGNVFGNSVTSLMPLSITPGLLFDNTTLTTKVGILSSPTDSGGFDLSASMVSEGRNNISATNWNTNNALTEKNWYSFFSNRLSQAAQTSYEGSGGTGGKPAVISGQTYSVYKTDGDLTITSPWLIGEGEKLIIIVNGVLDIRDTVTFADANNGFVAFIVQGDILIDSSVGGAWDSTTPVVEGMYIAGGSIKTGLSTVSGKRKFIGKGMFVAEGQILMQRDLETASHNHDTPADLFIYNPAFLVTMPDIIKDISYTWQEIVP